MMTPLAVGQKTEAPPPRITISRGLTKWEFKFDGPVRRRDINRLQRQLVVEFNRLKRKTRLEEQARTRNTTVTKTPVKTKETADVK